jgi:hypothetical protein
LSLQFAWEYRKLVKGDPFSVLADLCKRYKESGQFDRLNTFEQLFLNHAAWSQSISLGGKNEEETREELSKMYEPVSSEQTRTDEESGSSKGHRLFVSASALYIILETGLFSSDDKWLQKHLAALENLWQNSAPGRFPMLGHVAAFVDFTKKEQKLTNDADLAAELRTFLNDSRGNGLSDHFTLWGLVEISDKIGPCNISLHLRRCQVVSRLTDAAAAVAFIEKQLHVSLAHYGPISDQHIIMCLELAHITLAIESQCGFILRPIPVSPLATQLATTAVLLARQIYASKDINYFFILSAFVAYANIRSDGWRSVLEEALTAGAAVGQMKSWAFARCMHHACAYYFFMASCQDKELAQLISNVIESAEESTGLGAVLGCFGLYADANTERVEPALQMIHLIDNKLHMDKEIQSAADIQAITLSFSSAGLIFCSLPAFGESLGRPLLTPTIRFIMEAFRARDTWNFDVESVLADFITCLKGFVTLEDQDTVKKYLAGMQKVLADDTRSTELLLRGIKVALPTLSQ